MLCFMQFVAWFLRLEGFKTLGEASWNQLYANGPPDAALMADARQKMQRKLHPDKVTG